ncbi:MAG: hypothetical protein CVT48_05890 [Thermoplasmata archaeon HGW-Thermoplasmata-1]|nr:MAG: hypothetical protein CVT48_05890 [Thermoplasmata archaeon HGW-Thermoplasmata-1]
MFNPFSAAPSFGDMIASWQYGKGKSDIQHMMRSVTQVNVFFMLVWLFTVGDVFYVNLLSSGMIRASLVVNLPVFLSIGGGLLVVGAIVSVATRKKRASVFLRIMAALFDVAVAYLVGIVIYFLPSLHNVSIQALFTTLLRMLPLPQFDPVLPETIIGCLIAVMVPFFSSTLDRRTSLAIDLSRSKPRKIPMFDAYLCETSGEMVFKRKGFTVIVRFFDHLLSGMLNIAIMFFGLLNVFVLGFFSLLTRKSRDAVHLDASLFDVGQALEAMARAGPLCDVSWKIRAGLKSVTVRKKGEGMVRIRKRGVTFPHISQSSVISFKGKSALVKRVKRMVEDKLLFVGAFTWSATGLMLEKRINTIFNELDFASFRGDLAFLLDEVELFEERLASRTMFEEERALLFSSKLPKLKDAINKRLSSPQRGGREEAVLSPVPVAKPAVTFDKIRRHMRADRTPPGTAYVPYWKIPFSTRHGDFEVCINANNSDFKADTSLAIIGQLTEQGLGYFIVNTGRETRFFEPTLQMETLLPFIRSKIQVSLGYDEEIRMNPDAVEMIYVPYWCVAGEGGRTVYVNGITGSVEQLACDAAPVRVRG